MAGTFVKDANATELLVGTGTDPDLASDSTAVQFGGAVQVNAPMYALFVANVVDPNASNDATLDIGIQGCETDDFSTSDVVEIAWFSTLEEAKLVTDGATTTVGVDYELGPICVKTKFIRVAVKVDDGTAGDFTGSTLKFHAPFFQLGVHFNDSIGNASQPSAGHKL